LIFKPVAGVEINNPAIYNKVVLQAFSIGKYSTYLRGHANTL
jgi:hypothetical protein